jgi:hypothetical protein
VDTLLVVKFLKSKLLALSVKLLRFFIDDKVGGGDNDDELSWAEALAATTVNN